MNASIQFVFESRLIPDKYYKLLMFSTGSIKVNGVKECFALSEVRGMVGIIRSIYHSFVNTLAPSGTPISRVAMGNYAARF